MSARFRPYRRPVLAAPRPGRQLGLLGAFVVLGLLFGLGVTRLPAPAAGPPAFWIGNMLLPWLLVPFLAGWAQRDVPWGAVAGLAAVSASTVGFYSRLFRSAQFSLTDWLFGGTTFAGSGPAASLVSSAWQWLALAAAAGLLLGAAGGWRAESGSALSLAPIIAACLLEPACWFAVLGYLPRPLAIWLAEPVIGLVTLGWLVGTARRPDRVAARCAGTGELDADRSTA